MRIEKLNVRIIEIISLASIGFGWLGNFYVFPILLILSFILFKLGRKMSAFWSLLFGVFLATLTLLSLAGLIKSW